MTDFTLFISAFKTAMIERAKADRLMGAGCAFTSEAGDLIIDARFPDDDLEDIFRECFQAWRQDKPESPSA